jgi:hypothetical protein
MLTTLQKLLISDEMSNQKVKEGHVPMAIVKEESECPGTSNFQTYRDDREIMDSAPSIKRYLVDKRDQFKDKRAKKARTRTTSLPAQPIGIIRVLCLS